ncbi:MAG: hypothetical protein HQK54_01690 [Oligoflexales bacterium]|nr:hypothetical protein [Oligoflexales bacterium]
MLLLSRGIYWDGQLIFHFLKRNDFDVLWWSSSQIGRYDGFIINAFIASFSDPILAFKVISFISILVGGLAVFYALKDLFGCNPFTSYVGFCLFSAMPFYSLLPELSLVPYHIQIGLFMAGNVCAAYYFSRDMKFPVFLAAALCLWFSFSLASLVVLELPVLLLVGLYVYRRRSKTIYYLIFCVMPFISYFSRRAPYGIYSDYNKVDLSVPAFLAFMKQTIKITLSLPFHMVRIRISEIDFSISSVVGILSLLIMLFVIMHFFRSENRKGGFLPAGYSAFLMLFSVVSTYCAVFPYVAVDKIPYPHDFHIRHFLPYVCVIPLMFFAFRSLLYSIFKNGLLQKVIDIGAVIIVILLTYENIWNYVTWDYDWYKQIAITNALREKEELLENCDIATFSDYSGIRNKNDRLYRVYDWSSLLTEAIDSENILVASDPSEIPARKNTIEKAKKSKAEYERVSRYLMASDYTGGNAYCLVSIFRLFERGQSLSDYLKLKYAELTNPEKLEKLLEGWIVAGVTVYDNSTYGKN